MKGQVFRRRAEQFARLADLASDRPGADVARQLASDAEATHLVALTRSLRGLRFEADPDPEFRDRLRQRLVAVASVRPPPPASSDETATGGTAAPRRRPEQTTRAGSPRLAFLAGLAAALVLVTGLTLLASSRALPGDLLYAVKRSGEQVEYVLAHNPQERGLRKLSSARTRLAEVGQLIARDAGTSPGQPGGTGQPPGGSAADAGLLARALADMDADTKAGAALVTGYAVQHRSDQALVELAGWTAGQRAALNSMRSRLPGPARAQAGSSLGLLTQLATRVQELRRDLPCGCLGGAGSDYLGPRPCLSCQVAPHTPAPRHPSTHAPRPAVTTSPAGRLPVPPPPSAGTSQPSSTAPPGTGPTVSSSTLPTVPVTTTPAAPTPSSTQDQDQGNTLCALLKPILC
jgi:hypothetical protein